MRVLLPVIAAFFVACTPERHPVELNFAAAIGGEPASCTDDGAAPRMIDLRFYVSRIRLRAVDGSWQPLVLEPDDTWQNDSVALVDLENGEGGCLNGSPLTNPSVRGTTAMAIAPGLTFEVGVPEALNHEDPLTASPPLAYTVMHWHWASGYKFLRAAVETADGGFFLHLGSNRCEGTIGDIRGCAGSNRAEVLLEDFRPADHSVVVDLGVLFSGAEAEDGQPGECMSGPVSAACEAPLRNLGIDFGSGESTATAAAFTAAPK